MRVPQAMKALVSGFHQDIFVIEPTLEGAVNNVLGFLTDDEKTQARLFLMDLLDGTKDVATVINVWNSLPKDIRLDRDEEVVEFLKYILGVLSREG